MITLDLQRLCELKAIAHPHAFLTANGFTHRTASALVNATGKSVRFDHLERLCRIFHALPHDLLAYKPTGRGLNPAMDVLVPLRKKPLATRSLNSLLVTIPPDDLINLTNALQARYTPALPGDAPSAAKPLAAAATEAPASSTTD